MALAGSSPRHAARALLLDAMRSVEKIQRTSTDAYFADEARDGLQQALQHLLEGKTEQAIDAIQWSERRLAHYTDPLRSQKQSVHADDTRRAKQAVQRLVNVQLELLTSKPKRAAKPRHGNVRASDRPRPTKSPRR